MPESAIDRLAQLQLLASALAEQPSAEQVARTTAGRLVEATHAQSCSIIGLESNGSARSLFPPGAAVSPLSEEVARTSVGWWTQSAPAVVAVPLRLGSSGLGSCVLSFAQPRAFSAEERDLIFAMAQQGALALERARLIAAEREERQRVELTAQRLARLQAVTAGLAEVLSPEGAAQVVVDQAVVSMNALAGCVALVGDGPKTLDLAAYVNLSEPIRHQLTRFSVSDSMLMAEAARTGTTLFLSSTDEGAERSPWLAQARAHGRTGSLACLPLCISGRMIGSMGLAFAGERRFDDADREFLVSMARQCAQALERVRLYSAERRARTEAETRGRQAAFLARAGAVLASSLDYSTTLASLCQLAVEDLADWCIIDLIAEDGSTSRLSVSHRDPEKADYASELCRDYPLDPRWPEGIAKTLRSGEPQLVPHIPDELITAIGRNPRHTFLLRALGYKSGMAVALMRRGTIIGALTFVRSTDERPYGPSDLTLAEALASRAAIAIDNARLYAQAMEAVQARDSFISIASHELRTPLSTFKLGVDVLTRVFRSPQADASERISPLLDKIRGQSDRLERLVSQLLDVSKLSAGFLKLERENFDVAELTRDVVGRFADEARVAGVQLQVDAATPIAGEWDRMRVEQVVTNLVSNALKYGGGSPVSVALSAERGDAVLVVRDEGPGIAPNDQKRIFDRFERAVGDQKVSGLGLGLWIVREIARSHGGRVSVESAPGSGACFTVRLPIKPVK